MKRRSKMPKKKSRKLFKKTSGTHRKNISGRTAPRGGYRI